jgi:hypothetical protein
LDELERSLIPLAAIAVVVEWIIPPDSIVADRNVLQQGEIGSEEWGIGRETMTEGDGKITEKRREAGEGKRRETPKHIFSSPYTNPVYAPGEGG